MALVGLTAFASQIVLWLPLLGMFTGFLNTGMALILMASAWGILMLFNLITLPIEFDASARARVVLRQTGLMRTAEEEKAVTKVLSAAAWTYVAAFITSLVYFCCTFASARGTQRVTTHYLKIGNRKDHLLIESQSKITRTAY
jgi:uncharacterized protein